MIQLRTLGTTDLGPPGADVRAVLAQPKRLALLAYLALARPRGPHRKDTLRALFWPEADDHHARLDLNRAVYFLRHTLGADVIGAGPGDALAVTQDAVWCDAVAFEEALDGGRLEEALELYRGGLLDGFFASVAPEFEHWLDREREHFRKRAVAAALALADREEARGNVLGAARWATRATEIAPYAEGAMRRLLGLLDRAGDRAEAVRTYHEFARRLEADLGVTPAPETLSLIGAIRARAQPGVVGHAEPDPERSGDLTRKFARRVRRAWRHAIPAAALASGLALGAWILLGRQPSPDAPRIAVLPFENIGGAEDQDYFADGLTEEIILALSRLRSLRAISRTSTMRFKDSPPDPRELGRELRVQAVLEGSVRLTGSRVRVTAQLIDTRTNEHLWSELYERELADIFDIQADIARRIAGSLDAELSPRERDAMARRPTRSPAAYGEYLKGRHLVWGPDPARAIARFERAIALDSAYSRAYAGLADVYGQLGVLGSMPARQAFERAKAAAERAVALDPTLPEAHTALGAVHFWFEWDWDKAGAAYGRAFRLGRTGHLDHYVAYLVATGRTAEAIREAERRLDLDPLGASRNLALAWTYVMAGAPEAALAQLHRTIELHPGFAWARVELAWSYAFAGRYREAVAEGRRAEELLRAGAEASGGTDFAVASLAHVYAMAGDRGEALRLLEELLASSRQRYVDPFKLAIVHAGLGDVPEALDLLERAFAARSPQLVYLTPMSRNFFLRLRAEPRYRALQERMRLPTG